MPPEESQPHAHGKLNVIVLGSGERARRIAANLVRDTRSRASVYGFLDDDPADADLRLLGDRYLGRLDQLSQVAARYAIDWVIYGLPRRFLAHDSTANAIGLCETLGIDLTIPVDLFDTRAAYVVRRDVAGLPAISFSVHGRHARWQFAIKLDSPGPIFFIQPRCGRYGRTFPFLKFRTMVTDAEARKAGLRAQNEKSGPVFKMQRDPRVTRVGRILRKYSIDELPQLLNVVAGHMSLVGPRPPVPAEVEKYELDHRGRLSMRPGITCLWQVSGRNEIEFEDWVKLDIEYVERWSLLLDLQILLATFPAVISGRGAS